MRPIEDLTPQPAELLPAFQQLLPTPAVVAMVQSLPERFYMRKLSPLILLWGFVHQQLASDHTCDGVLAHFSSGALDAFDVEQSIFFRGAAPAVPLSQQTPKQNSSYCQGRKRLPLGLLQQCLRLTAHNILQEAGHFWQWHGRHVVLLDGSTLLTQSTSDLAEHYGRHKNQHGEGHWPVLRCVAAFDLHTGAVTEIVEGKMHDSEQALAVHLLHQAAMGATVAGANMSDTKGRVVTPLYEPSIYVADRGFGIYLIAQTTAACGQDVILRMTDSRALALLKRGKHSPLQAGEEVEIEWQPTRQDQGLSKIAPDLTFPLPVPQSVPGRLIRMRRERPGFRPLDLYLFTTLDKDQYSAEEVAELYGLRWHVELDLRYVKSTLGLAQLQAKSVEMARKELIAGVIAYNLIRGLMAMAAARADCVPLDLSFKRCWRRIQVLVWSWPPNATPDEVAARIDRLLTLLADCVLYRPKKPRTELRAVRVRPVAYPRLKGDRKLAKIGGTMKS